MVQTWSSKVDLFCKKFVFVPVVEDMHWSLACVCNLHQLKVRLLGLTVLLRSQG